MSPTAWGLRQGRPGVPVLTTVLLLASHPADSASPFQRSQP